MPNHSISFVKASDTKNDVMNINNMQDIIDGDKSDNEDDLHTMIGFIDIQHHKGQETLSMGIAFSYSDILKHAPDGPLYIAERINGKPKNGILIDHICVENMITEEFLFVYELYQD